MPRLEKTRSLTPPFPPPPLPYSRYRLKQKRHSTIYSTLRRREPNGCDEKELVGRVFHTSTSADKGTRGEATGPGFAGGGGGGGGGVGAGGGGLAGTAADGSDNHPFSKTKVRGAVTLLKFAQVNTYETDYFLSCRFCVCPPIMCSVRQSQEKRRKHLRLQKKERDPKPTDVCTKTLLD